MNKKNLLFFIAAFLLSANLTFSATRTWTGNSNSSWSNSNNWSGNNIPNSNDDVVINAGANNYPTLSSNTTIRTLTFNGGSFNMSSSRLTVQNSVFINGGTFNAGSNSFIIDEDLVIDGGTLNAGSGEINIDDDFILESGLFNGSTGEIDADDYFILGGTFTVRGNLVKLNDNFEIEGGDVVITNTDFIIEDDLVLISGSIDLNGFDLIVESELSLRGATIIDVNEAFTEGLIIDFSGQIDLDFPIYISDEAEFNNGILNTNATNLLIFSYDATVSNANQNSHVNGPVRKNINSGGGTNTFVFPIGNGSVYAPLEISSYTDRRSQDYFIAQYFYGRNQFAGDAIENSLYHVSQAEYWDLQRAATSGTPTTDVDVKLFYDEDTRSGIVNTASQLRIAHWNGTLWENLGRDNGGSSNNSTSGYTKSSSRATSFSPFTLASSTSFNPLPIILIDFDAVQNVNSVDLNWKTTSELNNDFFTVEKSIDGINWFSIGELKSQGNSQNIQVYNLKDIKPSIGLQFYRLKQTDFDGAFEYSSIISVNYKTNPIATNLNLYPNPTNNVLNVNVTNADESLVNIKVYNIFGVEVVNLNGSDSDFSIDLNSFVPGTYMVQINMNGQIFTKSVLKY